MEKTDKHFNNNSPFFNNDVVMLVIQIIYGCIIVVTIFLCLNACNEYSKTYSPHYNTNSIDNNAPENMDDYSYEYDDVDSLNTTNDSLYYE